MDTVEHLSTTAYSTKAKKIMSNVGKDVNKNMPYGMYALCVYVQSSELTSIFVLVRLGNSGLKISKIVLGCMSYGDPRWLGYNWIIGMGICKIKICIY
jgi:hypothetical protein